MCGRGRAASTVARLTAVLAVRCRQLEHRQGAESQPPTQESKRRISPEGIAIRHCFTAVSWGSSRAWLAALGPVDSPDVWRRRATVALKRKPRPNNKSQKWVQGKQPETQDISWQIRAGEAVQLSCLGAFEGKREVFLMISSGESVNSGSDCLASVMLDLFAN